MAPLNPSSNKCYSVSCPTDEADERLNLKVRTGAATCINYSRLFAHGGLVLPLDISEITLANIERELNKLVSADTENTTNTTPDYTIPDYNDYISDALFILDIMERKWTRCKVAPTSPTPRPRIFHTVVCRHDQVFVFGGLLFNSETRVFEPLCDLWRFDAYIETWTCVCPGAVQNKGRFGHSMLYLDTSWQFTELNHPGILIAGGRTVNDVAVAEFDFFDVIDNKWVPLAKKMIPIEELRTALPNKTQKTAKKVITTNAADSALLIYEFSASMEADGERRSALVLYTRVPDDHQDTANPLVEMALDMKSSSRRLPLMPNPITKTLMVPTALRYVSIGTFGDHVIAMGFHANNAGRISIYLYHVPSGTWTSLKLFCDHEAYSHKISRGYVWGSHHRILLLGDAAMHDSLPSVQYFGHFMTVALPFVNVSGSSSFYLGVHQQGSAQITQPSILNTKTNTQSAQTSAQSFQTPGLQRSFVEYSRYMAPQVQMTSIQSVFPPYAVTLGRNAFERFGASLADFEFVSAEGHAVPIPSILCRKRWGRCFEMLIAKGYVRAVDSFEKSTSSADLFGPAHEPDLDESSVHEEDDDRDRDRDSARDARDSPRFRLPFQELLPSLALLSSPDLLSVSSNTPTRKPSVASASSLPDSAAIPPLKAQPGEPAPQLNKSVLGSLKTSSSPSSSPRGSISGGLQPLSQIERRAPAATQASDDTTESPHRRTSSRPRSKTGRSLAAGSTAASVTASSAAASSLVSNKPSTKLLEKQLDINNSKLELLLLPRAIYLPFSTTTVALFLEFLATGQVGSKWCIVPTTLDVILLSKFYEIPLLYDLILEILYSIIGNKENKLILDANELRRQYVAVMTSKQGQANLQPIAPPEFPSLNGFADFLNKFNNGILDLKILKRISKSRKESVDSDRKKSQDSGSSSMASSRHLAEFSPMPSTTNVAEEKESAEEELEEGDPRYVAADGTADVDVNVDVDANNSSDHSSDHSTSSDGIGVGIGMVPSTKDETAAKRGSSTNEPALKPAPKSQGSSSSTGFKVTQFASSTTDGSAWPTLGQLTALNAPPCSDVILDFIYEIGALAGDMKLMVRAANALDISQKYEFEKREILKMMDSGLLDGNSLYLASKLSSSSSFPGSAKPRNLFGKFDIGNSAVSGSRYEKRGSITSILSNSESVHSLEMGSSVSSTLGGPTSASSRYHMTSQLSSGSIERADTFDSKNADTRIFPEGASSLPASARPGATSLYGGVTISPTLSLTNVNSTGAKPKSNSLSSSVTTFFKRK